MKTGMEIYTLKFVFFGEGLCSQLMPVLGHFLQEFMLKPRLQICDNAM